MGTPWAIVSILSLELTQRKGRTASGLRYDGSIRCMLRPRGWFCIKRQDGIHDIDRIAICVCSVRQRLVYIRPHSSKIVYDSILSRDSCHKCIAACAAYNAGWYGWIAPGQVLLIASSRVTITRWCELARLLFTCLIIQYVRLRRIIYTVLVACTRVTI